MHARWFCEFKICSFLGLNYFLFPKLQVEYKDHSGETRLALAEAPNEALPIDCRPNFRVAWLTKDKFKVSYLNLAVSDIMWNKLKPPCLVKC